MPEFFASWKAESLYPIKNFHSFGVKTKKNKIKLSFWFQHEREQGSQSGIVTPRSWTEPPSVRSVVSWLPEMPRVLVWPALLPCIRDTMCRWGPGGCLPCFRQLTLESLPCDRFEALLSGPSWLPCGLAHRAAEFSENSTGSSWV